MIEKTLSQYIGTPPAQITRLLGMSQAQIYEDQEYQVWVNQLNAEVLEETLPYARAAYEKHLPHLAEILKERYGMVNTPMSAYTLGNWLVGFMRYPETIINLSQIHSRIPAEAFRDMLPDMIAMLNEMPTGRAHWQRALSLMALPLIANR